MYIYVPDVPGLSVVASALTVSGYNLIQVRLASPTAEEKKRGRREGRREGGKERNEERSIHTFTDTHTVYLALHLLLVLLLSCGKLHL